MEFKTLVYGILAVIVILVVGVGFFRLTYPQFDIIKSLKCSIPAIGKIICPENQTQIQQQIIEQTIQAQRQNIQNIQTGLKSQFKTCGEFDKGDKCRCTYTFSTVGNQPVVITQRSNSINITALGKNEIVEDYVLYYDNGNHELNENFKLKDGEQIIFVQELQKGKICNFFGICDKLFYIKLKEKNQNIGDAKVIKEYKSSLTEVINTIGLFKDQNRIGIYMPDIGDEISGKALKECAGPA